ncbi:hypothetical protein [Methanobacterium sp. CWC-01]|uniref:hypothetical protein n=1 Tax=Methanobacterium aridiramus TaxID=2584467 RepID=UPI0025761F44|nr:hypothetical protein [Methanobacterium sp. CWC-01]
MRNIKALWHVAKVEHNYWVGGYWVNVYLKMKVTVKIRYPYLQWVPGYLWRGWLPIPGHLEFRVGWHTKTVGMTIRVSRYIPRRKITYYTYKLVRDENDIPVYFAYNLDMNRAQTRINYSRNMFFGSSLLLGGLYRAQQDLITEGISKIYEGGEEYSQHLNETGRGDDYLFGDPLFYIPIFKI